MSHKKDFDRLRTLRQYDYLQWETAKEMGLADENKSVNGIVPPSQAPDPGRGPAALVEAGEEALAREGRCKAEANLADRDNR
ncbi:MAG: small acid-soluble spore protein [Bacillota bacterium]|nr:small acid-soluble spore protein [Bacillota bacterium]